MLEPKTIQMVNELIQAQARYCINSNQLACSDDIKALAELITAVNVPPEQSGDPMQVIGFIAPDQCGDPDGDDE